MRLIPMVRWNVIVPFVNFLDSVGAPAERLLQEVRISPRILETQERLLPLYQCLAFAGHAADTEKLADLGLLVGLRTRFCELGDFARLVGGALTLHEALDRLIGAIALHNSGETLWVECNDERAMLCHTFTHCDGLSDAPGRRPGELFTLAMMIEAVRAVVGPRWLPDEIRLSKAEEPNRKRYETPLGAPVVCTGRLQAVVFAPSLLAAPSGGWTRGRQ